MKRKRSWRSKTLIYKEVGNILRIGRKRAGLTQEEVSKKVGCSRVAICNIEGGQKGIDICMLDAILRAIGMTMEFKYL